MRLSQIVVQALKEAADGITPSPGMIRNLGILLTALEGQWSQASTYLTAVEGSVANYLGVPGRDFIGIFNTDDLPSGWLRDATFDGYFLRGAKTYGGTGGAEEHTHSYNDVINHTHGHGTLETNSKGGWSHTYRRYTSYTAIGTLGGSAQAWTGLGTPNTGSEGDHAHGLSGTTEEVGSTWGSTDAPDTALPPYIDVIFAYRNV